ncbi:MAG: putative PEP-binding protein [Spirochaetia bacterium]
MQKHVHYFKQSEYIKDKEILEKIGRRGRQAMEFAELDLPILPGFIIDSLMASTLENESLQEPLEQFITQLEKAVGKSFGDPENPLLVKIVISPNLAIVHYPTLHNYGLTDNTIEGFNKYVGEHFGYHEVLFLIKGTLEIEHKIAELENRDKDQKAIKKIIDDISDELKQDNPLEEVKKLIEKAKKHLPDGFFDDAHGQLEITVKRISKMLDLDELDDEDTALIIQPMVYGNYGKDSSSGYFNTRDIVTGEDKLQGQYFQNKFNEFGASGNDINKISKTYLSQLTKMAKAVEDHFKEIRSIRFTIENKKLWLIDQRPVMAKSTQADIRTLLDLRKKKVVDDAFIINAVKPLQLNEILHPIIDTTSTKSLKKIVGGISGAPGAAIGRVYFSTDSLLEAYKNALQLGEDARFILCMPATFAEDVKAIEIATGVLSNEGGYSAHASVVARQYGKVSLVKPELKIQGKKATIDKVTIKEGDYISLNVPHYGDSEILLGQAKLIEPNPKDSGLLDYVEIMKDYIKDFHVRVNTDTPKDAEKALQFGAEGIGLCRTEHMFFNEDRINVFREMIISDSVEARKKVLTKLKKMQKSDFSGLMKTMAEKEVTIRLLDAPLHEFLPHNKDEMKSFIKYLDSQSGEKKISEREIRARCDALEEFNPMLGHRGCRIAVSYPEIYEMQIAAIFEAAYELKSKDIDAKPEIMIPLIMNSDELKLIMFGKKIEGTAYKGLIEIEEEVRAKYKTDKIDFKMGTMIELPVAALGAGDIARYAQFFSFGTNDLTQTTIGLSRDDFNSFMPDYTQFDILSGNPFQVLNPYVKELIETAVRRGTMTRPTLKKGICGEHGAIPENIRFAKKAGLDYTSCSLYSVPIALLTVAQLELNEE